MAASARSNCASWMLIWERLVSCSVYGSTIPSPLTTASRDVPLSATERTTTLELLASDVCVSAWPCKSLSAEQPARTLMAKNNIN